MKLAHIRNPIMPALDTRLFEIDGCASVTEALDEAGWHLQPSTFLIRRDIAADLDWQTARPADVFVKRRDWELEKFGDDETALLVTLPQGGGGQGGSNVLLVVAQLALLVAAFAIAGPAGAGAALGGMLGTTAAVGTALVFGTVMIAGQLLLSAILPQPKSPAQPKPTFTIGVQSNTARLGQAIPERFGRTNFAPDLRSQAYLQYDNNAESIFELFCLGTGSYYVEQIRIGTNVIAQADGSGVLQPTGAYPEITWQLCGPNEPVTLFPDNVVTSTEVSDVELLGTNQLQIEGVTSGWTAWFVANPPNTETSLIALDMSLPNGLYFVGSSGDIRPAKATMQFEAQPINDVGAVTGSAITFDVEQQLATNQPQRFTVQWNVPCGRYQVRAMRTNGVQVNTSQPASTLIWASLRSFLPSQQYYGNSTMLAIQSTASYSLSQLSANSINVVATRMLSAPALVEGAPQWSASPVPTRSIAAAANYLLSSSNNANLDPSQYDRNWLAFYDLVTWGPRGDTLDGAFDSQQGFWDMLNAALNVGRTQALAGPFIGFVRDEAKTTYRCAFTPRTMIKDSFNINYLFFDPNKDADAVTLNYIDETNWTPYQLFIALPDATDTIDTAPQVNVTTMVNRAQIWREWNYKLAASAFRRIFPTFQTELDGRVCFRGDRVRLSHVMASWGMSADVVSIHPDFGDILTLSEPWIAGQTGQPMIEMTTPDGYHCGPATVNIIDAGLATSTVSPGRAIVQLTEGLAPAQGMFAGLEPDAWGIWGLDPTDRRRDLERERPKVLMGQGTEMPVDALVVSMTPRAGLKAELQCVVDNPAVYTADQTPVPPYPTPGCSGVLADLTIDGLAIQQSTGDYVDGNDVVLAVTVEGAPDASSFDYQYSLNGGAWVGPVTGNGRSFSFRVAGGAMRLQVRGVASGANGFFYEQDFNATGSGLIGTGLDFVNYANSQYLAVLLPMGSA